MFPGSKPRFFFSWAFPGIPQQPALSIPANIGLDPRRRCVAEVDLVDLCCRRWILSIASVGKRDGNMGKL